MNAVNIVSIASVVPEQVVTSAEIINQASGIVSNDVINMMESMSIKQRYSVVEDYANYLTGRRKRNLITDINELAVKSIKKCIESANKKLDICLVITITNTAMRPLPCMAYEIIAKTDESIIPRDVSVINMQNQGCSALVKAIEIARFFMANTRKQALITVAEVHTAMSAPTLNKRVIGFHEIQELSNDNDKNNATRILNNLINSYLFGDGAVSLLLENDDSEHTFQCHHLTNISMNDTEVLHMDEGGSLKPYYHGFPQYYLSKIVPKKGIFYSKNLLKKFCGECSMDDFINDIDLFLIHTGSKKIIDGIRHKLNLDAQSKKIAISYFTIENYGNLSSCSLGFMLERALNVEKKEGSFLLISFGVGFSGSIAKWSC